MEKRTETKKNVRTREQIKKMSDLDVWNLEAFASNLNEAMSDWTTKIPGMGMTKQVRAIKDQRKIVDAFISELGEHASASDLLGLGRKEKVRWESQSRIWNTCTPSTASDISTPLDS